MEPQDFRKYIKDYQDFPKKGVIFRDISPLLADPKAYSAAIEAMEAKAKTMPAFDKIVAVDARGFIFGGALALRLCKGLILIRKAAKLPGELATQTYGYEYASDTLSLQRDAIKPGDRFLIVDDVLASGNTLLAAYQIITKLKGQVAGILCLVELSYLDGRKLLKENLKTPKIQSVLRLET